MAERTETVATKLGLLNTQLENLSSDLIVTSDVIGGVASSVETLQDDLLSAEGSFSEAADKMESTASFIENGSFSSAVAAFSAVIGVFLLLTGLYQITSGIMIRRLMKSRAVQ